MNKKVTLIRWSVVICLCLMHVYAGAVEKSINEKTDVFKRDAYLHFVRGLILEDEGKYEEALKEYTETVRLDPEASFVVRSLSTLNLRIGKLDAALQAAKRVQELEKSNPDTYFLTGSIYLIQEKYDEAEKSFLKVLEFDPYHKDALLHLAALTAEKSPKKAVKYLEKLIELEPQAYDVYFEMALLYSRKKSGHQRAIKYLEKAVELNPRFFNGYLTLAQLYEQDGKYQESIKVYEKCLKLHPQNTLLQAHMGILYLQVGNIDKAEEMYNQIVSEGPEGMDFLFWLGVMAEEKKDWPKAIEYVTQSLRKAKDAKSLLRLSYYYVQMGKRNKAIEILKEVIKIDPSDTSVRLFLAYAFQEEGEHEKAIHELEEACAVNPDLIDAHFQLGILYEQNGKFHKAIGHFYRVLEIKEDHAAAANYLGYSFADRNIQIPKAEELIRLALQHDPDNPAYLDSLGWVYYRQGKYAEALAELSKASLKADDPIIKEHLGDAHWAMAVISEGKGSLEHAFRSWNNALIGDPSNKSLKKKINQNKKYGIEVVQVIDRILSPAVHNLDKITDVSCFITLSGSYEKSRFRINGVLFYRKPAQLKLQLLGPLMNVWCTITYSEEGLKVSPDNAFDRFLPKDSSLSEEVMMLIVAYLDGAVIKPLAHSGIIMDTTFRTRILFDNTVRAAIHKRKKVITSYEYFTEAGDKISVRFKRFKRINDCTVPRRIECNIPARTFRLRIDLHKVKVNPVRKFPDDIFKTR